ncbi:MAG TPA: PEP/pyruvate-binding domain-containing protein [Acidimicrobiia bacterium]|nr:PEP/pyruvate-binding domain-containing protein [Acidimicrobiia bacterium]
MTGNMELVDLAEATRPEEVGQKAAGLGRADAAGFEVPAARVVPISVTRRIQQGDEPDLRVLLAGVLEQLGGNVAVRSSAVDEDTEGASYAGQYTTVLGVSDLDGLVDAVRSCVGSVDAGPAASYREHAHGHSRDMAVLIQRMLAPEAAGVAFGVDPVSGQDHVVIEATAGIAEGVLEGSVTPEHWVVERTPVLESAPGDPALTEAQAAEVAALCRSVGAWEGRPADIEWALEHGELFLLQTRPITAVPQEPTERPPRGETWIREPRFDSPIDLLTFSAWLPIHGDSLEAVFSRFGVPLRRVTSRRYLGRVYFRTEPLLHGNDRTAPPEPVLKLLLRLVPPIRKRLKTAGEMSRSGMIERLLDHWDQGERERTRAETRRLRETDLEAMDDAALSDHLGRVLDHVREVALYHFEVMFAGTLIPTGQLGMFVEEKLGWSADQAIGLVSGYGSASLEHGRALAEVAARLGPEGIARALSEPGILLDDPQMDAYLDRFGHRMGMGLSMPTEAEAPATITHHLRRFAAGPPTRSDPTVHAHQLEAQARALLTDPADREEFDRILVLARRGRPYGDETEGDTLNALAPVRYIAMEAARRLVGAGRLERREDIWLLEVDELQAMLAEGAAAPDLQVRRREQRWSETNPVPEHFGPDPVPPPSPTTIPPHARPVVGALMWSLAASGMDPVVADADGEESLRGLAGSPGKAVGPVRIIRDPSEFHRIEPGDILVCPITMASWSPVFGVIGGLVTERGGPLSHPATLAREYGIPAVLSLPNATSVLGEGSTVSIDGGAGTVEVM